MNFWKEFKNDKREVILILYKLIFKIFSPVKLSELKNTICTHRHIGSLHNTQVRQMKLRFLS